MKTTVHQAGESAAKKMVHQAAEFAAKKRVRRPVGYVPVAAAGAGPSAGTLRWAAVEDVSDTPDHLVGVRHQAAVLAKEKPRTEQHGPCPDSACTVYRQAQT